MKGERGSIAPLGIGLTVLLISAIFALTSAGSLYVFQTRLKSLAEFAALNEARTGLSAGEFLAGTNQRDYASLIVLKDETLDGLTFEVELCAAWSSPLGSFGTWGDRQVCSGAAARSG
jgi:hypothetical protein